MRRREEQQEQQEDDVGMREGVMPKASIGGNIRD